MIGRHTDARPFSLVAIFLRNASEEDTSQHYYGVVRHMWSRSLLSDE